jgi:hypothetical protein
MKKRVNTENNQTASIPLLAEPAVMVMLPTNEQIQGMVTKYMISGRTIGGGDSGWIEAAYKDGLNDLVKMLKGN